MLEIALAARRTRKGELVWGLPKGALEEGETPEQAGDPGDARGNRTGGRRRSPAGGHPLLLRLGRGSHPQAGAHVPDACGRRRRVHPRRRDGRGPMVPRLRSRQACGLPGRAPDAGAGPGDAAMIDLRGGSVWCGSRQRPGPLTTAEIVLGITIGLVAGALRDCSVWAAGSSPLPPSTGCSTDRRSSRCNAVARDLPDGDRRRLHLLPRGTTRRARRSVDLGARRPRVGRGRAAGRAGRRPLAARRDRTSAGLAGGACRPGALRRRGV